MTQDKYQNRVKLEQNPDYFEHPSVDIRLSRAVGKSAQ